MRVESDPSISSPETDALREPVHGANVKGLSKRSAVFFGFQGLSDPFGALTPCVPGMPLTRKTRTHRHADIQEERRVAQPCKCAGNAPAGRRQAADREPFR